ncbi:hypothetical protein CAPTEDRAFT_218918 [Capitella teleta]|uniref:IkappaB kinase n=1 Tax=Capitella teleta TaxID=283909 RepID=R7T7G4_CAPTE|nr:hypothetical protein CAPTEDRAFT_218918 [Capitella teleta]|eukprot:ELT87355.1 hypothetical protein CAPTEDRAFT_218918 [Capitella teleta]
MASRISKVYEAEKYVYYQDVILGHGATSTVHLGRHRKEGTEVAVKVLKQASLAYFERENELLKRVQHKNVVQFMDVEDVGHEKWVILEWSKMGSVDNLLSLPENKFGICEEDLLCLLSDMVEALKFLSEKSVTHGDIKPRNILVYSEKSNLDMILLKPREAIGGYRGTLSVVKYDFDLAQHCRLKSNYLRRNFVKFVQSLLRVDISSIPPIDKVYQDMKAITHFHRVCLLNMTSWEFIICDIPERNEQENSTIPFRQRVFTELRKVIGEESLRRIVVPLDLVKDNDHEIDLMLTERVLKRTSVSKPLCIYADMKLSVEHFLHSCHKTTTVNIKRHGPQKIIHTKSKFVKNNYNENE